MATIALVPRAPTNSATKTGRVPDLVGVWIAYVTRELVGLRSSFVVLVSKSTGEVVCASSANDEG